MLSAVCKKLNNDIEMLANQVAARETTISKLTASQQSHDDHLRQFNMDLQLKLNKTDAMVQKLQNDVEQFSHGLREAMNNQQEISRANAQRHQELKLEVKKENRLRPKPTRKSVLFLNHLDQHVRSTNRSNF